ncbi:rhodanese-like domain-containing protein [Limnoglobus roseus]|uniref:Rhodanese-like domain-containing protein n=1 Tax=Limnoglobus roseus TaxID=2598579 RepID=A0A5C1ABV5_9BACT|nr:rhodanese-like domain-containing protein [Limnoglobus roseus]QEL15677.1 rhodanese-like domain-containing protein [Limnoglobus roseus]
MIPQIHPTDLKAKLAAGEPVYLLDVRQQNEYDYCRLADSTLIPLHELPGRLDEVAPPAGALVVVYCHHGVRSLSGAAILQQAGHANVASLSGGIEAWSTLVDPSVRRY